MPNHSYSVLKFSYHGDKGEKIKEIQSFLKSENSELDFEKIIATKTNTCEEAVSLWGTKWNAYDVKLKSIGDWKLVYTFQTAWSYPAPIIKKLHEIFKGVEITFVAADDGRWFAFKSERDENGKLTEVLFNRENNNDPSGIIRDTVFESLNLSY